MTSKKIFLTLYGLMVFFFAGGCQKKSLPHNTQKLPEDSIYWLEGKWKSPSSEDFSLTSLRGKKAVFAFIYSGCKTVCPSVVGALKKLESELGPDYFKKSSAASIVVISLDPNEDTPARLHAFSSKAGKTRAEWIYLVGEESGTRTLATALGMRYRVLEDGEISHSVAVTLLDEEGRPLHRVESLTGQEKDFAEHIKKSSK